MTDPQTYLMIDGTPMLTIEQDETIAGDLLLRLPIVSDHHSVRISPRRLLAMIDSAAPDALRYYLRERSDLIDSPDPIDLIPEADSAEDVDDHSEPVITVTPEALDAAEQLGRYVAEIRDAFARGLAR